MRQVFVQVPAGAGERVVQAAARLGATTTWKMRGTDGTGAHVDLVTVTVPNGNVGELIDEAQGIGPAEASVVAAGVYAFEPPAGDPPQELLDVTPSSPFEVLLSGRQSAGGWRGFLLYATVAGVVAWLGLFTETIYLLTGSMLIAPFAGPAMTTAIGICAGRPRLLRLSLLRYLTGIGVTAAVGAALTVAVGQQSVTGLTTSVLTVTSVAVLLPLSAGAAGAMYLVQAEHSSLISGAAVGVLVAASLAPPAGGLGMVLALGRWDLAVHALFLIALQLTGITVAAVLVLRSHGLRPDDHRFGTGHPRMLAVGGLAAAVLTAGLVAVQLTAAPFLTQGDAGREAAAVVARSVGEHGDLRLLEVDPDVRSVPDGESPRVLVEVTVERTPSADPAPVVHRRLAERLRSDLARALSGVVPHVSLRVHEPPGGPRTGS